MIADGEPAARWTEDYLESTLYFVKNYHGEVLPFPMSHPACCSFHLLMISSI